MMWYHYVIGFKSTTYNSQLNMIILFIVFFFFQINGQINCDYSEGCEWLIFTSSLDCCYACVYLRIHVHVLLCFYTNIQKLLGNGLLKSWKACSCRRIFSRIFVTHCLKLQRWVALANLLSIHDISRYKPPSNLSNLKGWSLRGHVWIP